MRNAVNVHVVLLLVSLMCASGSNIAWAQANTPAPNTEFSARTGTLPKDWSIEEEMQRLETSLKKFSDLSDSLGEANKDLQKDLQKYLNDPGNELLAAKIELKMAKYADKVSKDFDRAIADQDLLTSNFKSLSRKLRKSFEFLNYRIEDFQDRLREMEQERAKREKELIRLAIAIRDAPEGDKKKDLQRQFANLYRRFRLQDRYLKGSRKNLESYRRLAKSLDGMTGVFDSLQEKFVDLIDNLAAEKKYLLDSVALQVDSLKVEKLMRDGIVTGNRAIKNVSEKLAKLYVQVDAFNTVHERVNSGLSRFDWSQQVLLDVSKKIDAIGSPPASEDLNRVIEKFYERRGTLNE